MPKELELTIGERLIVVSLFNEIISKGADIETLALLIGETKAIAMTKEEWDGVADLVKTPDGNGGESWVWEDAATSRKFPLEERTVDMLKAKIRAKSDAKEFGIADKAVISLNPKLQ